MIIRNGLVFTKEYTFEPLRIATDRDVITAIAAEADCGDAAVWDMSAGDTVFDASGCYVLPGLTDIHFHGCDGYDFCDGTAKAFDAIGAFELSCGVTSICPSTMTLPTDRLVDICENAARYRLARERNGTGSSASDLVGIHLEGPFISARKKGAQNDAHIIPAQPSLLFRLQESAAGLIRLVTLAPEIPGSIPCIEACRGDFRFSIGHTEADYRTAMAAFDAGADHVTHLYNAMPPFSHREPGVIGAAFDTPDCMVELICDGVHISPSVVRATFRLFGEDRVVLVSDSMEATGKPDGDYHLGGLDVHVSGNRATLPDGTLAGSVTPLSDCMRTAVSMGIPLAAAVRAATINPCRSIGIDKLYGSIEVGKKAHFLILNRDDLSLKAVIKGS